MKSWKMWTELLRHFLKKLENWTILPNWLSIIPKQLQRLLKLRKLCMLILEKSDKIWHKTFGFLKWSPFLYPFLFLCSITFSDEAPLLHYLPRIHSKVENIIQKVCNLNKHAKAHCLWAISNITKSCSICTLFFLSSLLLKWKHYLQCVQFIRSFYSFIVEKSRIPSYDCIR